MNVVVKFHFNLIFDNVISSQKGFPTIDLYFNRLTVTVLGFFEINNFKRLCQYISVMWKTDKYNMSCRKLLTDLKLIMNRLDTSLRYLSLDAVPPSQDD